MSDQRKGGISWTDETWNPVRGCSRVSPGCNNCYAERLAIRQSAEGKGYFGLVKSTRNGPRWTGVVRLVREKLDQPLRWRRPRLVFVNSMSDLFHEELSNEQIAAVFGVMAASPTHTFQVLTKRAKRMRDWFKWVEAAASGPAAVSVFPNDTHEWRVWQMLHAMAGRVGVNMPPHHGGPWPLPNVWLGVSCEDQVRADERIPLLLETPAAVRWVSAEPLLGPIDFANINSSVWPTDPPGPPQASWVNALNGERRYKQRGQTIVEQSFLKKGLNWVVVGGESGPGARPMHPDWARLIRDQCEAAGVAFHFKQWGAWAPHLWFDGPDADKQLASDGPNTIYDLEQVAHVFLGADGSKWDTNGGRHMYPPLPLNHWCLTVRIGKKAAGRELDGVVHDAYPEVAA